MIHIKYVVTTLSLAFISRSCCSFCSAFQTSAGWNEAISKIYQRRSKSNANGSFFSSNSRHLVAFDTHRSGCSTMSKLCMSSTTAATATESTSSKADVDAGIGIDIGIEKSNTITNPTPPPSSSKPPQIAEFIEPRTKTRVILIGTMHYNPTSIQTTETTIRALAQSSNLGSVIVESCDVRWNTTMELLSTPRGKLFEGVLTSEMKAASDVALEYGRPCVLGDQRINVTGVSLGDTFRRTFVDVASPIGGWGKLVKEFRDAAEVALPSSSGGKDKDDDYPYLNAWSILDPRLLIAAPVSFAKYPLSFLARNPLSTMVVFSFIGFLTFLDAQSGGDVAFADASLQEQIGSILASLAFMGLEFGLFGRIMVQVLLAERNEVIAKNILDQCRIYSKSQTQTQQDRIIGGNTGLWNMFSFLGGDVAEKEKELQEKSSSEEGVLSETMYVPGSLVEGSGYEDDGKEKVVVAVLGMAHCNGIVKLLKDELV